MVPSEYSRLSQLEKDLVRLDKLCDGNFAAKYPELRRYMTIGQAIRIRKKGDKNVARE